LLSKFIRVILLAGIVVVLALFIHWQMNPEDYKAAQIAVEKGDIVVLEGKEVTEGITPLPDGTGKKVYLRELRPSSAWFNLLQLVLSGLIGYLMIGEVIRILRSVKAWQTFSEANIRSFRRLGYFCLALLVLNCLRILSTGTTSAISFHIDFNLLLFMLTAFILAEIFREGQRLHEQEKLTI
jgi:hypothetical protein